MTLLDCAITPYCSKMVLLGCCLGDAVQMCSLCRVVHDEIGCHLCSQSTVSYVASLCLYLDVLLL